MYTYALSKDNVLCLKASTIAYILKQRETCTDKNQQTKQYVHDENNIMMC